MTAATLYIYIYIDAMLQWAMGLAKELRPVPPCASRRLPLRLEGRTRPDISTKVAREAGNFQIAPWEMHVTQD